MLRLPGNPFTSFICLLAVPAVVVVLTATPIALGQACDDQSVCDLATSADFFGVGARATAMGNTGIAYSQDGAAIVYNPAALARIKRMELHAGLSHFRGESDSRVITQAMSFTDSDDMKKTRLNSVSLTVPVPTYRGSLVFAFGLHRVNNFDRPFASREESLFGDTTVFAGNRAAETGGLWKWSAAGAMDISPRLSAGAGVHLLTGSDKFVWSGDIVTSYFVGQDEVTDADLMDQTIETDYLGVSASAGLTFAVSRRVTAGFTIETPSYLTAEETASFDSVVVVDTASSDFTWETVFTTELSYLDFTVIRPLTLGVGIAGTFERLNLVGDLRYADWSQLNFNFDDPALDAEESATQRFIADNLTEVVSVHFGAEYLFPAYGLAVRAGYFFDPLPIASRFIESDRQYFTAGLGFLIDRVMTLDLAYVDGGYEVRDGRPGSAFTEYQIRRAFATFGYRI